MVKIDFEVRLFWLNFVFVIERLCMIFYIIYFFFILEIIIFIYES